MFGRRDRGSTVTTLSSDMPATNSLAIIFYSSAAFGLVLFLSPLIFIVLSSSAFLKNEVAGIGRKVALISYAAVFTSFFFLYASWSISRSRLHPFLTRCFPLVFVSCAGSYIALMWVLVLDAFCEQSECHSLETARRWIANLANPVIFLPYCVRGWRLHVIFNAKQNEASQDFRSKSSHGVNRHLPQNCMEKCYSWRDRLSVPVMLFIFTMSLMPFIILSALEHAFNASISNDSPNSLTITLAIWIFENGIFVLLLAYFLFQIRDSVWDEFNIRYELLVVLVAQTIYAIVRAVTLTVGGLEGQDARNFDYIIVSVLAMRSLLIIIASLVHPLYESFVIGLLVHYRKPDRMKKGVGTLTMVLGDADAFDFFSDFMETDEDSYLLQFYVKVSLYKDPMMTETDRRNLASEIYHKYLDPEAEFQYDKYWKEFRIKASSYSGVPIRTLIGDENASLPIGMFDTAVNYVYEMMEAKTLPRFLKSEQCTKLRMDIERRTLIHNRLVSGGMIPTQMLADTIESRKNTGYTPDTVGGSFLISSSLTDDEMDSRRSSDRRGSDRRGSSAERKHSC